MAHGGVKIEVNLDKSKLQGSMKGLEGEMVKSMAIFEVMKQTITKVFGMITDSIDQAMRRIDTMDQFSRVMSTMTGSTDKANAALERTNAIVQGTAFGLDTASKGVQSFVASGMEVSKATGTMEAWGDAVAFYTKGTNAELETVSAALQKMQTKGNVTMEHMQMMLEAGIPAIQIYAAAVGKSTEDVTDQMSKGELKTEDFITAMNGAFRTGVTGFPSIAGAAKNAGASWQGSMDNMKAATARGTAAMLEQLDAVFDVKGGMVDFGKTMEKVLKTLAQNLDVLIPIVVAAVTAFVAFKVVQSIPAMMAAAKAAIQAFGQTLTTTTGIIGIVIAAVVAIMGVVEALSNRMDGYVKKFEESVGAANAQHDANQQLLESLEAIDAEYDKAIATAETMATAQHGLVDRIVELNGVLKDSAASSGEQAAAQREMQRITGQLNSEVAGLSLEIDEATGSVEMNEKAVRAAIDAQEEYNKAVAGIEKATQKLDDLQDIEAERYLTEKKLEDQQKNMNELLGGATDGWEAVGSVMGKNIVEMWDWAKAAKKSTEAAEDLTDDYGALGKELEHTKDYWEQVIADELKTVQAHNDAGESVADLASKYGVSMSEIQSWMDTNQDGLQSWEDQYKTTLNDAGENIEQVAARWGTTVEAIQASMEEDGVNLQAWEENQEKVWEEFQNSVAGHTDAVINSFKEIPAEYEMSADEMIEVLRKNRERYAEWKQTMTEISGQVSAETLAELEKLGPGALSAIQEMQANGGEGLREFDAEIRGIVGESTDYVVGEMNSPEFTNAGANMMGNVGAGMTSSNVPNEAAQAVADGVVSNLSNADYSAITEAMATAIKSGTNAVQSAAQSMATAVAKVLQKLSTDARTEMTKTMTLMASSINTGRATLTNAMTAAMTAVKTAATTVANTFNTIGKLIITNIKAGIDGHASAMSSSITAVMNAAKSAANAANTGWENIGYNMVAGMASGVRNNESILTSAIRSVVNAAIQAAKTAAVIKSPSRAFRDQVGRMIPLGIAEGVDDETLAAVKSVKNMTNQLIGAGSASLTAKIAMANSGASGGGGSTQSINMGGVTIVRPPETPGQAYRALQRTGRQMIKQFGR